MVTKEPIIYVWKVERRVKCMPRFATRDLKKGYSAVWFIVQTIIPTSCR